MYVCIRRLLATGLHVSPVAFVLSAYMLGCMSACVLVAFVCIVRSRVGSPPTAFVICCASCDVSAYEMSHEHVCACGSVPNLCLVWVVVALSFESQCSHVGLRARLHVDSWLAYCSLLTPSDPELILTYPY